MGEILYLVHRIPFPPDRGDKIRSYHLLQRLARIAPVHCACFADDARDAGFESALEPLTATRCVVTRSTSKLKAGLRALSRHDPLSLALFHDHRVMEWVQATLSARPISHIVVFSSQMAQYVPADFSGRVIMDFVDVDSAKFSAYAKADPIWSPWKYIHGREGRLLHRYERAVAARSDASVFVSEAEASLFRAQNPAASNVVAVGNGVDTDYFDPDADFVPLSAKQRGHAPWLLFSGQMDYRPNVEAVQDFAQTVLPKIRRDRPDAEFVIVGRNPAPAVLALQSQPGVRVIGGVDDMRSWLAAADVVVAPLRIARGVQNKLLEAMAMGRAVVASPAAAEGIDGVAGRDFIVGLTEADEASQILALLNDPARATAIGDAARMQMLARYSWNARLAPFEALFAQRAWA